MRAGAGRATWFVVSVALAWVAGGVFAGCGDIKVVAGTDAGGTGADTTGTGGGDTGAPVCTFGDDKPCDDGNTCTEDRCTLEGQCEHTAAEDVCNVDGTCYAAGTSPDLNPCLVCDPTRDAKGWSDKVCDDGNPCTTDLCDASEGCKFAPDDAASCDDGDP